MNKSAMPTRWTRTLAASAALAVSSLVLAGCGSDTSGRFSETSAAPATTLPAPSTFYETPAPEAKITPKAPTQEAKPSTEAKPAPSGTTPQPGNGLAVTTALEKIPTKGRAPKTGYDRDQFGKGWKDPDRNGCDTRNDVLNRDLSGTAHRPGTHDCMVTSGVLKDPYTNTSINFERGQSTSTRVQIDHVVALSNAWQTGAQQLSADQRLLLANDPMNLLAVDGPTNGSKSDGDAATWLPPAKNYRCAYVARQTAVKLKYGLWMTSGEKAAIKNVVASCPGQTIPTK